MRLDTLMEIAKVYSISLPLRPDLRSLVQVQRGDSLTIQNFLSKFQYLRLFYRSQQVIERITREVVMDAASDGVVYMDLHFTPAALSRYQGFPLSEVMDWVAAAACQAAAECGMDVRLIASVNRHESVETAAEVVALAADRIAAGIVGLDLAGNEAEFSAEPFAGLFREARQAGLRLTIHAGEWGGADNVRQAVEQLNADRVVHGVRVMDDASVVALARERNVPFAVCLTSNYQTGVVDSMRKHPLMSMLASGLNVSLSTDDPGVSAITLSDEYALACEYLGLPRTILQELILNGARAAFVPAARREELMKRLAAQPVR